MNWKFSSQPGGNFRSGGNFPDEQQRQNDEEEWDHVRAPVCSCFELLVSSKLLVNLIILFI